MDINNYVTSACLVFLGRRGESSDTSRAVRGRGAGARIRSTCSVYFSVLYIPSTPTHQSIYSTTSLTQKTSSASKQHQD